MPVTYPRPLSRSESELLEWVLPAESPGYAKYWEWVRRWMVIGEGRRGEGSLILGSPDVRPDETLPTSHVIAYGVVETSRGSLAVDVRERVADQIEVDIMPFSPGVSQNLSGVVRRWTLSTWKPGDGCPQCGVQCREVPMTTSAGRVLSLAFCRRDRRIWLRDDNDQMTMPIPLTNFYNELMLHLKIREPRTALHPDQLFRDLDKYSDLDMLVAFRNYNVIHTKIRPEETIVVPEEKKPAHRFPPLVWLKNKIRIFSLR